MCRTLRADLRNCENSNTGKNRILIKGSQLCERVPIRTSGGSSLSESQLYSRVLEFSYITTQDTIIVSPSLFNRYIRIFKY